MTLWCQEGDTVSPLIRLDGSGGRSQLVHSASDVGPGEYTAEQGMELGPTAKLLGNRDHTWKG